MTRIVFDVDGRLIDSRAHFPGAMTRAFAAQGLAPPPPEAVPGIVGLSLPQALARLAPKQDIDALDAALDGLWRKA